MYETLREIVAQLEACGYACEAGPLVSNTAFVALKTMAEKEEHELSGFDNKIVDRFVTNMVSAILNPERNIQTASDAIHAYAIIIKDSPTLYKTGRTELERLITQELGDKPVPRYRG